MKKMISLLLIFVFAMIFTNCEKKEPPMVLDGFYFDYKKYNGSKQGGCVAGGIVNYTWDVNLVNVPLSGSAQVSPDYYLGSCDDCCGIQVTNNPVTERYYGVSGMVWREGHIVNFNVEVRDENSLSDSRKIKLKGSFVCEDD